MDFPAVFVIADSFLSYLAAGCDVPHAEMAALLESGGDALVDFVRLRFDGSRLIAEDRTEALDRLYGEAIRHRDI